MSRGVRLDLVLVGAHPGLSRRKAQAAIQKGQVTVDGRTVLEPGAAVPAGAQVRFDPSRPARRRARLDLPVLYEDAHVLVVDKPAGLLSVPVPGGKAEDSALARVQAWARRLRPRGGYAERVHRLDRDTSGALAFALSREARAGMIALFRAHRVERRYAALVVGRPRAEEGVVDAPVHEEYRSGRRRVAAPGEPSLPARTRYRVLERLAGAALLEVEPETGRQHQIRLHLAHVGLPIAGDRVYGRDVPGVHVGRPLLHARTLGFAHPVTGAAVRAESPLPDDFARLLRTLRARR